MVLVEVARKAYLASLVPVIVNSILNEHQIVVDIVAFVGRGDFPRSRLGEKQRGKILNSWVSRKLRTVAQFAIRDNDSHVSDATEAGPRRTSVMASSLRNVEPAPQILEEQHRAETMTDYTSLPTGISEMPSMSYENSIAELPTQGGDSTPTDHKVKHFELADNDAPGSPPGTYLSEAEAAAFDIPKYNPIQLREQAPPPPPGPKPKMMDKALPGMPGMPGVSGTAGKQGDLWSLPSQQGRAPVPGLRVQNVSMSPGSDDESWKQDARMHLNLAER